MGEFQNDITELKSLTRKRIDILTSDSEIEVFQKMLQAFENGNCDVHWESGIYTFSEIYLYMRDQMHWNWTMGLPIGGNNRYYFNNSILIANRPAGYLKEMNILDSKASANNYELYDGILINNGGFYCVHDEVDGSAPFYKHFYKNMRMEYHLADSDVSFQKCIGGGIGQNGIIILEDCSFSTDNVSGAKDISWHGNLNNDNQCRICWIVTNCYFSRGFQLDDAKFKDIDSYEIMFSNNSVSDMNGIPHTNKNCTIRAYNNNVRSITN